MIFKAHKIFSFLLYFFITIYPACVLCTEYLFSLTYLFLRTTYILFQTPRIIFLLLEVQCSRSLSCVPLVAHLCWCAGWHSVQWAPPARALVSYFLNLWFCVMGLFWFILESIFYRIHNFGSLKNFDSGLGWCGSVDWVLAYEPKGHWFNS